MAFFAKELRARKFKMSRTISALVLREMSTTYGRSPGGYIWALLEPVAAIALLSVVFSLALRSPGLGTSFPFFYASGFLPFMFYSNLAQKVSAAIAFSRPLLKYPSVTYIDAILARFILAAMTHCVVFVILISAIVIIQDLQIFPRPIYILNALLMAACLGLGIGTLNCFLIPVSPTWAHVWKVLNAPLFLMSGVIFMIDRVPEPYDYYLTWNPVAHVVVEMRRGLFANYHADFISPAYVYGISLVAFVLGLIFLNRYNRYILNN
ncbi:ABC transporter permease [Falsihalocynthiibacter sp. SS001]|uniref:ABC transporter permease n=1 Tax=Falsihalocynthiibacter sp. SS001 TaxID=3349698 RepID=UPI0036D24B4E